MNIVKYPRVTLNRGTHKWLQLQAVEKGVTMQEIAEDIIHFYRSKKNL